MTRLLFSAPSLLAAALLIPLSFAACDGGNETDHASGTTGGSSSRGTGGLGGTGGASDPIDTSLRTYEADDPKIHYMGRFDTSDPQAPVFSAPAVEIAIRFRGDRVTALLEDEFKWGNNRNFYDVVVDGAITQKVALEKGEDRIELATELAPGNHTLRLVKRTEASIGQGTFHGFEIGGTLLDPPATKDRKLVFIGDSITAGSGAEAEDGSQQCEEGAFGEIGDGGWGQPYHNAHLAFGPVAARKLNADYHVTAVSGIGLVRNYSNQYDARPMPEVYDLIFAELDPMEGASGAGGAGGMNSMADGDEPWRWNTSLFIPDGVVIALGTNDFSPGDNPPEDPRPDMDVDIWTQAYIDFVDRLRNDYPDAEFFAVSSPMLGDGWPDSDDTFRTDQREGIEQVIAHYEESGWDHIHSVMVDKITGRGCGTHPDTEQQKTLGEDLATEIESVMGWE